MGADQIMDRLRRYSTGPDLAGQSGKADLDAFLGVSLGLPVQRLVLAALLEEDHGEQVKFRPAPRRRAERGGPLVDPFAVLASERFADGLHDLPLPGNDLQRLSDVFAHFQDARRSTAGARGRCLDHYALAGHPLAV